MSDGSEISPEGAGVDIKVDATKSDLQRESLAGENRTALLKQIADEILRMKQADQKMRANFMEGKGKMDPVVDDSNTRRMIEIMDQIGWPTREKVGEEASYAAWLLVQHADDRVDFQKRCLELMKNEPEGKVNKKNLAYLEDRVRVNEGRAQLYGILGLPDKEGHFVPFPIEDPGHLNDRREQMGLLSFEMHKEGMEKMYAQMKAAGVLK